MPYPNDPYDNDTDYSPYRGRAGRSPTGVRATTLLFLGALALIFVGLMYPGRTFFRSNPPPVDPRPVTARGDLAQDEKATIELFEKCSKSVVYVSPIIRGVQRTLFGYRDVIETGTGSGFIWDTDGHIITNFHVVQDASQCQVTLPDNSSYQAAMVGYWPDKDIAVLRIDAHRDKLVPIAMGTSGDLRVGQKVFAIGNPFGLDFTLTTGVVSALQREIESPTGRTIQGVIQTDAAINPGNSGGPLLDSAGRLIGMNTAIYSEVGVSAGIGFAVPVDTINDIVPQLISHGKVIRPGLGVNIADDSVARRLGLKGVLVLGVAKGSAAERAGIRPTVETGDGRIRLGDIITAVGPISTPDADSLLNALENYEVGQSVDITIDRQGASQKVDVTLQAIQ